MTIDALDRADAATARAALARCCGASAWLNAMLAARPFGEAAGLRAAAESAFARMTAADWREAFEHHPRIGDLDALRERFAATRAWAGAEQSGSTTAGEATRLALRQGNLDYEARFGHRFIVFASGRSADEMLVLLRERLANPPGRELEIAAAEAARIARLRIDKLLEEDA